MRLQTRISKIETTYGIKVIGLDKVNIIYSLDGYVHKIRLDHLASTILDSPKTMISDSYVRYLNNTTFKDTSLEAVSLEGNILTVVNTLTYIFTNTKRGNVNVEVLLNTTNKYNKYKEAIIKVLGNNYQYDKCFPEKLFDKVIITCPIHGDFEVKVSNILYRQSGCPHCANEYRGYSRTTFEHSCIKNNDAGNGTLYVIKIIKENESFIKVGITSFPDLSMRCRELKRLGCAIEKIHVIKDWSRNVYNTEKYIHKMMRAFKYLPSFDFKGRQECYTLESISEIEEILRKRFKNNL